MKTLYQEQKLRERDSRPNLGQSEVINIEIVGESLVLDQHKSVFRYFRSHFAHFFSASKKVYRITFVHQSARQWQAKKKVWRFFAGLVLRNPHFSIVDSLRLPVFQFAQTYRCQVFQAEAALSKGSLIPKTFYWFRIRARLGMA